MAPCLLGLSQPPVIRAVALRRPAQLRPVLQPLHALLQCQPVAARCCCFADSHPPTTIGLCGQQQSPLHRPDAPVH